VGFPPTHQNPPMILVFANTQPNRLQEEKWISPNFCPRQTPGDKNEEKEAPALK
jgi:hypothetical protein